MANVFGKFWEPSLCDLLFEFDSNEVPIFTRFKTKVTCKRCLKIMEKPNKTRVPNDIELALKFTAKQP